VTEAPPLVEARGLVKHFPLRGGPPGRDRKVVRAVDGVSFTIRRGETLSLVGESGSGKTTVGRLILRLLEPTAGEAFFDGEPVFAIPAGRLRALRRRMTMIFQDPQGSLSPRWTVEDIVSEGLVNFGPRGRAARRALVEEALLRVGLDPRAHLRRYPNELSGGQRQRVGIARALVLRPSFIVCDEPVSSLDVSIQAQILNLLAELKREEGHSYLFISHDLSVVRHLGDRVAVLYLGRIAEIGPAASVYASPHHPYTRALLGSVPASHPSERGKAPLLGGEIPSPVDPPDGCRFHTRCPLAMDRCRREEPPPVEVGPGHVSWCFLPPPPGR
jgi:oligopeptide/dipeptide ABC transporter ATP-binding protein